MFPTIALLGRPNVGKSTVFNYLTRSRQALVADEPGVTRDRQYGQGISEDRPFIVIDTGGLSDEKALTIQQQINEQAWLAVEEADIVFWITDARAGLTVADQEIAKTLRTLQKKVYLLINKSDGLDETAACADFHRLGITPLFAVSATQGKSLSSILQLALASFPRSEQKADDSPGIRVAVVGRPNAGKSTLINRMLGEERVIVYDAPGTTRDSIYIPFTHRNQDYVLIDTAGVRRRRSVEDPVEKYSVIKTLQAISEAHVFVLIIDAAESIADQDLHLLGYALDAGKAGVIVVNKWDGLAADQRQWVERELERRLDFARYMRIHFISALHGSGVGTLYPSIQEAYRSATRKLSTHKLTDALERAIAAHSLPAVAGRRVKLRYAHAGGSNPPTIVIHGNQTEAVPTAYRRYLENFYREAFSLKGTPIRIQLRTSNNPYKDEKNTLSPRQVKRRQRLMKHVKKG